MNHSDDIPSPSDRAQRIRRHYEPRLAAARENHEALDWTSAQTQFARFAVLTRALDLSGKALLDVGCGLGDLLTFLQQGGVEVDYTGVDILDRMVETARERHPRGRFVVADVFRSSPFKSASFDVVFCSGALNLNLGNNLRFLPLAAGRFFELSRQYVVFNLLHERARHNDDRYFHYNPDEVLTMLKPFNCRCRIIDDYLPNDFTCVCEIY